MLDRIQFFVNSGSKQFKIVVNVDGRGKEFGSAISINNLLKGACLETYLQFDGLWDELSSLDINTGFLRNLAKCTKRPVFKDYNNLYMPRTAKGSPLLGSHDLVELLYGNFFIAVDVAVELYKKNPKSKGTLIAEITVARSHDELNQLLMKQFKLKDSWQVNVVEKERALVKQLQSLPKEETKEQVVHEEQLTGVLPSGGLNCIIL